MKGLDDDHMRLSVVVVFGWLNDTQCDNFRVGERSIDRIFKWFRFSREYEFIGKWIADYDEGKKDFVVFGLYSFLPLLPVSVLLKVF